MFRNFRARRLSRSGEHTAALALSRYSDNEVLCRAGMYLTLLEHGDDGSIFAGIAHAHVGNVDRALEIAAAHVSATARIRPLLGQLAATDPYRVIPLLESHPEFADLESFCKLMSGQETSGSSGALSPLLACAIAIKAGDPYRARGSFEQLFNDNGLSPPQLDWCSPGLTLSTLGHADVAPMEGPLVSVVMTAYNEEECLPLSVQSLLRQSWRNMELIIVDDASTDSTFAVANELAAQDSRVRVVRLEQNSGTWRAKNIGFLHCQGDFVTLHDADDWSHPNKLEYQARPLLEEPRLQATTSSFFRVGQTDGLPFTRNACNYLRWNPSSLLFRRTVLGQIGNFLDKLLGSDGEFVARLETHYGARAHRRLRLPLSIGYQRPASLSNRFRDSNDGGRTLRLRHWESWRKMHVSAFMQTRVTKYEDAVFDHALQTNGSGTN